MERAPLFGKLFWPALVVSVLAAGVLDAYLVSLAGWTDDVIVASLIAGAVAVGGAWLFARVFARRVMRFRSFADGLLSGRLSQVPLRESRDELGALAGSLNRLSGRVRELSSGLTAEAERSEAILASMSEAVMAVDQGLFIVFGNEAFRRLVGGSQAAERAPSPGANPAGERASVPASLPAVAPVQEVVPDHEFVEMLRRAVISRESSEQRLRLPGPLGGRIFDVHAAPLSVGGRRGAVAVLHDISDLERLERVRRDFVANVSHELRTPLTAIRGYAETLLEGALEDKENNRRFLEIIKAHAIRLNNIASDLLALSELEQGRPAEQQLEPVSIRSVLENALRTVESEARIHDVKLLCPHIDDARVLADRVRLEQAFVNLLDNAIKFNRPGGEVVLRSSRTEDGKVRVVVADTGIGIPPADLPRIFERFYRVDKTRSREMGGTGLGLSIVKHVVEQLEGTVEVDSQLGQGSQFTVSLASE